MACSDYWSNKQSLKLSSTNLSSVWIIFCSYNTHCCILGIVSFLRATNSKPFTRFQNKSAHMVRMIVAFTCFTRIPLENNNKIYGKPFWNLGCTKSCSEFVSSRSWQTIKLPVILFMKLAPRPRCLLVDGGAGSLGIMQVITGISIRGKKPSCRKCKLIKNVCLFNNQINVLHDYNWLFCYKFGNVHNIFSYRLSFTIYLINLVILLDIFEIGNCFVLNTVQIWRCRPHVLNLSWSVHPYRVPQHPWPLPFKPCWGNLQPLYETGNGGCNATQSLLTFSWDMWHPLCPEQLFLTSRSPFLFTFTTKSYLRSETHVAYKFYTPVHPKNVRLEENFYLCVESVMRVLNPFFFFTSSHGVGLLFTYKVSDVVFVTKHFALKITLKF